MSIKVIQVSYMSGAGNLFSVVDVRNGALATRLRPDQVVQLCAPNEFCPRGTEGLLLLNNAEDMDRDFDVHFFNPDGSSSMMCGNGARCAVRFAVDQSFVRADSNRYRFLMAAKHYSARQDGDLIEVEFDAPRLCEFDKKLEVSNTIFTVDYIDVGSDHLVISADQFYTGANSLGFNEMECASSLRHHAHLVRGANVNIVRQREQTPAEAESETIYDLRTFERGVEDFTGACGTGALASAVSLTRGSRSVQDQVHLCPPSGQILEVLLDRNELCEITKMYLRGPAIYLGAAEITIEE